MLIDLGTLFLDDLIKEYMLYLFLLILFIRTNLSQKNKSGPLEYAFFIKLTIYLSD